MQPALEAQRGGEGKPRAREKERLAKRMSVASLYRRGIVGAFHIRLLRLFVDAFQECVSKEEGSANLNAGASSETDGQSSLNDSLDSKAPSSSTEPSTPFGDDPIKSIDECCEQVGEQHGLTPREREIFAMLAKGRQRAQRTLHHGALCYLTQHGKKPYQAYLFQARRAFAAGAYRHGGKRARITLEPPVAQAPFAYVLMPFVLIYRPGL